MARPEAITAVAAAGALIGVGLALGAVSQQEAILHSQVDDRRVAGNFILLTALLAAAGAGLAVLAMAPRHRVSSGAAVGLATYGCVQMAQTMFPFYTAIEAHASVQVNLLAKDVPVAASLLVPVLAVAWASLLLLHWGVRRATQAPPPDVRRRHLVHTAVAIPFLCATVWGPLEILLRLPAGSRDAPAHALVLTLQMAAALAWLATSSVQAWQAAQLAREQRLRGWAGDIIAVAARVQAGLLVLLALLAIAARFLAPLEPETLQDATFGADLRGHHLLLLALVVPLLPAWWAGRRLTETLPSDAGRPWHLAAAAAAALALAGAAAFLFDGVLATWIAAATPALAVAWTARTAAADMMLLWVGYLAWAAGNTLTADFTRHVDADIRYAQGLGQLALWRLAGLVLAGAGFARLAARLGPARSPATWTLAIIASALLALAALLELPITAWTVHTIEGQAVGFGSLPASQDPAVRFSMHALAGLCIAGACVLIARLWRPEWFGRGGVAVAASEADAAMPA